MPYIDPTRTKPLDRVAADFSSGLWKLTIYKDICTATYILEAGVWYGDVAETPNNGGLALNEATGFSYWPQGVAAITIQESLALGEQITADAGHLFQNNPPSVDKLQLVERTSYQLIRSPYNASVTDSIALVSNVALSKGKGTDSGVRVREIFSFGIDTQRSVVESLTLVERISYYLPNVSWINPGTPTSTPIGHLTLTDLTGSAGAVTLRVPKFGDSEKNQQTRIQRNTRGGDLQVFNDPMWPATDVFHFEFEYLTGLEATLLLTFLSNTLGRNIQLTDHYSREILGFVITPEDAILQPVVNGFGAKFDFQIKEG